MGVLFITHDLGVVAEIADRAIVLYKGEIAEENKVEKILQQPQHPYTKALLACRPHVCTEKGERLPVVSDFFKSGKIYKPGKTAPCMQPENLKKPKELTIKIKR